MVEEALGVVNEASIALVSGVVGLLGGGYVGYVFGVLRTLSESRNDRRDAGLAEIYKELSLFHRYLASWTADYDPDKPTAASAGRATSNGLRT